LAVTGKVRRLHVMRIEEYPASSFVYRFWLTPGLISPGGQKGPCRSHRKWMIRLTQKFWFRVVTQVYLADHKGLYQNPRLHPLSPTPKTHCFKPRKLQSDAVPKSTLLGTQ
jgi:hypothetical protein